MAGDHLDSSEIAHDLYVPLTYDWMLRRISAAEGRLDSLATQSTGILVVTFLAIGSLSTLYQGVNLSREAALAGGASIGFFLMVIVMVIKARSRTRLNAVNPGVFVEQTSPETTPSRWIDYAPEAFRERMLRIAGMHTEYNTLIIAWLHNRGNEVGSLVIAQLLTGLACVGLLAVG